MDIVAQLRLSFEDIMTKTACVDSCTRCGSESIEKHGRTSGNRQRYLCRSCGKCFIVRDHYADDDTRKKKYVWNLFIDCMLLNMSCRKAASVCSISKNTAFAWRHRLFDAVDSIYNPLPSDASGSHNNEPGWDASVIDEIFLNDVGSDADIRVDVDEWHGVYMRNVTKYRKWDKFVKDAYASGYEHEYITKHLLGRKG